MDDEIELARLRLADKSDLVLTKLHVCQHREGGIFGENRSMIPREAIAGVKLDWRRSRGLLVLGTVLLAVWLVFLLGSVAIDFGMPAGLQPHTLSGAGSSTDDPLRSYAREFFSSFPASVVQYALLLGGIGVFLLFWFYKRNAIQIMTAGASIGGIPKSYDEARKFCDLLFSDSGERPTVTKGAAKGAASPVKAVEPEWRL